MKLVIAIVQDTDAPGLTKALLERGFQSTKLASTGGFLREGNTTLLIGLEDEKVPEVLELIKEKCGMTAAEYIDRHTVTECMAMLNSTSLSMNQISRMMNFPSPSVFGKFFKRMTGVSPTEYRNGESAQ